MPAPVAPPVRAQANLECIRALRQLAPALDIEQNSWSGLSTELAECQEAIRASQDEAEPLQAYSEQLQMCAF